ncbi:MAG: DUF2752 domain-containing protein [Candidatus Omnitrophica bacterium]|nr:DUF2752 domain-containing protein [Candidatus Omnitrophota bacterium]MCA9439310.1 DUF2752 domain-containing protein [Candidatus Omnitrophota bacterium]MCB9769791.1 DUF2752 domain-containing protein [Candidatus Omnitrophota bacterium]
MSEPHYFLPRPALAWLKKADSWLRTLQPETGVELGPSASLWGNPRWSLICLIFLLIALVMPAEGFGVRLCVFHQFTGLDCPGCGMTRGISQLWRGHPIRAVQLHLFAPVAFAFLAIQASSLFIPAGRKVKVLLWIDRHDRWFRLFWVFGAASFFLYGGMRIAFELFQRGFF